MSTTQAVRAIENVQQIIGYMFTTPSLLETALEAPNFEQWNSDASRRLAFVGYKVMDLALFEVWYYETAATEGRASLGLLDIFYQSAHKSSCDLVESGHKRPEDRTNKYHLKVIGHRIGLENFILPSSSQPAQGQVVPVANAVKAILGAVYLDSCFDFAVVRMLMRKLAIGPIRC